MMGVRVCFHTCVYILYTQLPPFMKSFAQAR